MDFSKIAMALPGKIRHASKTEDFESDPKIVKFVVVKKREGDPTQPAELTSFEDTMLPHLDAAHNFARWLLRNEQDAQDVVQEAYLRAFKSFGDSMAPTVGLGCSRSSETPLTPCSKRIVRLIYTTAFDEEIHATGYESVSPATILEHSENAELIKNAMDGLPVEFREILTLRHQEGLSYNEIADISEIPSGYGHVAARPRPRQTQGIFSCRISKEK